MKFLFGLLTFISLSITIVAQPLNLLSNTIIQGKPYITAITQGSDGNYFFATQIDHVDKVTTGSLTKTNQSGALINSFSRIVANNHILSIKELPDGKILIGGWFTKINGSASGSVIRLNANGTIDDTFIQWKLNPFEYVSRFIVQSNQKIVVVGSFSNYDNSGYNNIVRLNADGSVDDTFGKNLTPLPFIPFVEVDDQDNLAISDGFTLHKLLPNGIPLSGFTPLGAGPNGHFFHFKFFNTNEIIVAGNFDTFGDASVKKIARIKGDGTVDAAFTPGNDIGPVVALAVKSNGTFLIAADNGLVRGFDNTGNAINDVYLNSMDMLFSDNADNVILTGGFNHINGQSNPYVARLKNDFTVDDTFNSFFSYTTGITSIAAQPDGKILISGNYSFAGVNDLSSKLVRINLDGSLDPSFSTQSSVSNTLLLQSDGKILITSDGKLKRLLPSGEIDNSFHEPELDATVYLSSLKVHSNKIYVSGDFASYDGYNSLAIVRLNMDGTIDNTFKTLLPANSYISSFNFQSNGKLIATGIMPFPGGIKRIIRLNVDGSLDDTFSMSEFIYNQVSQIRCDSKDRIYISGSFNDLNGAGISKLARLKKDGEIDATFTPNAGGANDNYEALEIISDSTIFVGNFSEHGFTVLDTTGQQIQTEYTVAGQNSSISASYFDGKTLFFSGRILSKDLQTVAGVGFVNLVNVEGVIKNLSASRVAIEKIKITWNNDFTNADAIVVERSENNDNSFSVIQTLQSNVTNYEDNNNIKAESSYFYRLRAANSGSFSSYSNVAHVMDTLIVGIEEKYSSTLNVYPNPTKNFIYLAYENKSLESVEILNTDGKKVASLKVINNAIDVSSLPSSTYIFVISDTSKKIKHVRIIKE